MYDPESIDEDPPTKLNDTVPGAEYIPGFIIELTEKVNVVPADIVYDYNVPITI